MKNFKLHYDWKFLRVNHLRKFYAKFVFWKAPFLKEISSFFVNLGFKGIILNEIS